ncbi:hypothetical protein evm_009084 [Chilo suppressalis]|nr:hypothetical protein evm_009084 [Chilo suppressalis]
MAKGKNKKEKKDEGNELAESDLQDEVLLATTDLEPEPEEVQYTDTSYTSASFESLPPIIEEPKPKKKKGKKLKAERNLLAIRPPPEDLDGWSARSAATVEVKQLSQRQAILAGAKEKRAQLARERAELMAKDNAEQEIRRDILQKTCDLFHKFERQKMDFETMKQLEAEVPIILF